MSTQRLTLLFLGLALCLALANCGSQQPGGPAAGDSLDSLCQEAATNPNVIPLLAPALTHSQQTNRANPAASDSFTSQDKLVITYYFYWYDASNPDPKAGHMNARIHHEMDESPDVFTWKNAAWHQRHLSDMIDAGIDIVLPVYWGVPCALTEGTGDEWSKAGLLQLVAAEEALLASGARPPRIGMFYDTSSLGTATTYFDSYTRLVDGQPKADLTTAIGRERFYLPIWDFFSQVPSHLWARIDGKPIVWLYNTAWVDDYDASTFGYVSKRFAEDFGIAPYIVREKSWEPDKVKYLGQYMTDNAYVWGTSLYGYNRLASIAAIGPGYDESAIKERFCLKDDGTPIPDCTPCAGENTTEVGCPRIRERDGGAWYESQWQQVLAERDQINIVAIETWNEYHEGNDIAETRELGRQYIDLTAEWVARFKGETKEAVAAPSIPEANPAPTRPKGDILYKKIESSLEDSLWLLDSESGQAERITSPHTQVSRFWMPDEKHVVFDGAMNVLQQGSFVIDLDTGQQTPLAPDATDGWWTWDGKRYFYLSSVSGHSMLNAVSYDGSNRQQITADFSNPQDQIEATASSYRMTYDGARIAFLARKVDSSGILGSYGLYVGDADRGTSQRIADVAENAVFSLDPALGGEVAIWEDGRLRFLETASKKVYLEVSDIAEPEQDYTYFLGRDTDDLTASPSMLRTVHSTDPLFGPTGVFLRYHHNQQGEVLVLGLGSGGSVVLKDLGDFDDSRYESFSLMATGSSLSGSNKRSRRPC
jgi:uncharacterized protein YcfL